MKRILTLCVGNICRSPIAQALLARELPGHEISSAGLSALVGQGADPQAQDVARRRGLDLGAHRAQQITAPLCLQQDLVLVMEQAHKEWLENQYPPVRGKVFRLGQLGNFDIADPYRQDAEAFEAAYAAIARGVTDWVSRIRKLS